MKNIMSRIFLPALFGISAALFLTGCGPKEVATSGQVITSTGQAAIGGSFSLVDHHGKPVTEADFFGKPQLVFFGFSFCPDVCPTALQQMGAALELAGAAAGHYQPIFITIDPERDTPEQLALYVTANGFPKGLTGLTGTDAQITAVKDVFAVYGKKVTDPTSAAEFTFEHSSIIYLMDAQGKFVSAFSHTDTPEKIAKRLVEYKETGH